MLKISIKGMHVPYESFRITLYIRSFFYSYHTSSLIRERLFFGSASDAHNLNY
jgi:hypothetical protein